jgi:hypothetical protein
MDFSLAMAAYAISTINYEARSALPDAPVVAPPPSRGPSRSAAFTRRRVAPLLEWLAGALHRAAWAIEPGPRAVIGPEYSSMAVVRTDDRQWNTRPGTR